MPSSNRREVLVALAGLIIFLGAIIIIFIIARTVFEDRLKLEFGLKAQAQKKVLRE
jgi:hypothetical protein